ncbi:MAG: type II secretion system protein [Verrucomicrobiota bacterium]
MFIPQKYPLPKNHSTLSFLTSSIFPKFHQNMKLPRTPKGFTLIELLVVISIIAVLASLAVPAVTGALVKGQIIQAVSNCRQIHLAAMSMATDAATNSDPTMGWPGDTNGATAIYNSADAYVAGSGSTTGLVSGGYLNGSDLKVFATAGVTSAIGSGTSVGSFLYANNSAFYIYKLKQNDDSTAVFLTTKNFDAKTKTADTTGTAVPFGTKGFVICRKGGDVGKYQTLISGTASYTGSNDHF